MRFLADENFPGSAVDALRASGHDVIWIRASAPGSSDREVLAQASHEQRILLTFDKDFGEWPKRHRYRPHAVSYYYASLRRHPGGLAKSSPT
ncbi:DUF5615 family PIN-like protein [Bradyrhizobium vignae]|uniref:DUF5615 family PIN-like protein n=1 Tax=Bradyrhizobium vignae TaxID=1549949 RepID=UPI001ABF7045|nr:DUF5615 family PIN-like protein [Bradyrhizobium vignae]